MKKIGILLIASTLVLGGCGKRSEGTDSGVTGYDENGNPISPGLGAALGDVINVRVLSTESSVLTGQQGTAEITALITNDKNQALVGEAVAFEASSGALQNAEEVTNEFGEATATLSLKYHKANQPVVVTVKSGNFSGSVLVVAEGSTLAVVGDNSVVPGSELELVATLTSGDNAPIADELINISSKVGNTLSTTAARTNPLGNVTVNVGTSAGNDTIYFTALPNADGEPSVDQSHSFTVAADQLSFGAQAPTEGAVNVPHEITVNLKNDSQPLADVPLRFTITAGQIIGPTTIATDSAGNATVTVMSSTAGPATITAIVNDGTELSNKHVLTFVGDQPAELQLDSTSSRVATADIATISAIVVDANGNPVKNTDVEFSSANLKGGQLNPSNGVTDENGVATTTFTAGTSATQEDEVVIVAEVVGSNINGNASLTVVEPVLNVTIGSSNKIVESAFNTQNRVSYVVQVADGSGQPIEDAQVQLSIEPLKYFKGRLVTVDTAGFPYAFALDQTAWTADTWSREDDLYAFECISEDANGNRILDNNEDNNGNGSLDPQDPASLTAVVSAGEDVATITSNNRLVTDTSGSGYFDLLYPVSNALWSVVKITARAQALGTEAEDSYTTTLLMSASEANNTDALPANATSPYGTESSCNNTD